MLRMRKESCGFSKKTYLAVSIDIALFNVFKSAVEILRPYLDLVGKLVLIRKKKY